ncbi:MAG TPA: hypothetical protein VFN97_25460 [Actinospica sp.]|nr:hypothetical protein [Actinospica sp.]
MMSRASRMLKWVGAASVLLAAAPIAWAEEPSRPTHPVVVPNAHKNPQVTGFADPVIHGTYTSRHLFVPDSTKAR